MKSPNKTFEITTFSVAELVRADTALMSFRDAGYSFTDAVGETIDNCIQASAKNIRIGTTIFSEKKGKKILSTIDSLAIADDGVGIAPEILANTLTIGFSTRYGNRNGIGRYGVGFKLASISQCKRLEIYTKPAYLGAEKVTDVDGVVSWTYHDENTQGRIFSTYLDLNEIQNGHQKDYGLQEVDKFPVEYDALMSNSKSGTLIVWRDLDRFNEKRSFGESADEKMVQLINFIRRAYRYYIDSGINIFPPNSSEPLYPYDPAFFLENPLAERLAPKGLMKGKLIEDGAFEIDGHEVRWRVALTPEVTRVIKGGGGVEGPDGKEQFKSLNIKENQGKISFLRQNREISYTIVPQMLPTAGDKNNDLDRHISIDVWFSPFLDEYFQVRHIKRGVEPITKLRDKLRLELTKPIVTARKEIRDVWNKYVLERAEGAAEPTDISGGRVIAQDVAQDSSSRMPTGRAGSAVTPEEELEQLKLAALDAGIDSPAKQEAFAVKAKTQEIVAVEGDWPGNGLLEITHLNKSIVVKINKRHPFIKNIYNPLKAAAASPDKIAEIQPYEMQALLEKAINGIDLLFFAYAKAENQHQAPEDAYMELREDWGKFASVYLRRLNEIEIA
jgi:hypothetical protein